MARTATIDFQLGAGTLKLALDDPGYALVTIRHEGLTVTARGENMAYTLASGMQVEVQVSYIDKNGHPAAVDGDVEWTSSDNNIAEVHTNPDDSTVAIIVGVGQTIGFAQIAATADADLGEGVREIITTVDVEVVAGEAVAGTIAPIGEAQPIPKA